MLLLPFPRVVTDSELLRCNSNGGRIGKYPRYRDKGEMVQPDYNWVGVAYVLLMPGYLINRLSVVPGCLNDLYNINDLPTYNWVQHGTCSIQWDRRSTV